MKAVIILVLFVALCSASTSYYLEQYWSANAKCSGTADYTFAFESGYCDTTSSEMYTCSSDGKSVVESVSCDSTCASCVSLNYSTSNCVGDNSSSLTFSFMDSCASSIPASSGGLQLSYYSSSGCSGTVIAAFIYSANCIDEGTGSYYSWGCSGGAATYTYGCTDNKCTTGCTTASYTANECSDITFYGVSAGYGCAAASSSGAATASVTAGSTTKGSAAAITFSVVTIVFCFVVCLFF